MVEASLLEEAKKEHEISKATIEALKQANEAAKVVHEQEKAVEQGKIIDLYEKLSTKEREVQQAHSKSSSI